MLYLFLRKKQARGVLSNKHIKRIDYLKKVLKKSLIIGKSQDEVETLLGKNESCSRIKNRWVYKMHTEQKKHRKYYLVVYFENGMVAKIRKEYKVLH